MLVRTVVTLLLFFSSMAQASNLNRGLGPEPDSLDIHQAQGLSSMQVLRDIREGLITFDARGSLTGGVAESWFVSEDGLEIRFRLRRDAKWSDGTPVVADDFVRAWQMALSPATQARTAGLMAPLRNANGIMAGDLAPSQLGVKSESDHQLLVQLEQGTPWFLEILAHPVSFPLHADHVPGEDSPVNGPFVIAQAIPQSLIRLEANPDYHDAESIRLESVTWFPIEDPGAELSRYRAGELDITETIPPGRFEWLESNLGPDLRVSPYIGSFWLGINLKREPLGGSVELRRALALALDRETLARVVLGAGEQPSWSVVPPGIEGYEVQEDTAARLEKSEREQRARDLYRIAGYGEDNPLRLELRFNTSTQHRRMAVAVSAMWKQVLGVQTQIVQEEWKVFVNNRRQGVVTQVFRGGWIADYADPASFLDLFRSDEELNNTFYANPKFDELLAAAAARQGGQRMQLLQQAELLLMRDMPVIPLYYYVSRHLVKSTVGGFEDNPRDIHLSRHLHVKE